jgi:hypothetical protein
VAEARQCTWGGSDGALRREEGKGGEAASQSKKKKGGTRKRLTRGEGRRRLPILWATGVSGGVGG